MNTQMLREHLLNRAPWVDPQDTVDTIKAGDPLRPITCVGVGWMATLANLRAAHGLGCELFITHEPTFWEHAAPEQHYRAIEPGSTKQRFLDETGLVVLRVHDIWDPWPKLGIRDSWAAGLGLTRLVGEDDGRYVGTYEVEPTTLADLASQIAARVAPLGEDSVRAMGDADLAVQRVAIGTGCIGPDADMIGLGAQAVVVCYDGAHYWRTRERLFELGAGVIVVEHGTSELWGMDNLSVYLRRTFPDLTIHDLDHHPRPWTVTA